MPALGKLFLLFLFLAPLVSSSSTPHTTSEPTASAGLALEALGRAKAHVISLVGLKKEGGGGELAGGAAMAWADCLKLYEDSEERVGRLVAAEGDTADARAWLSAAVASHSTCTDGLLERNSSATPSLEAAGSQLREALARISTLEAQQLGYGAQEQTRPWNSTSLEAGLLAMWDASTGKADIVVAQDGSGNSKTINEAVRALESWQRGDRRVVIYVKSGVYSEYVEINQKMRNVMLVGDGMDRTIVTGSRNVPDGYTTFRSATFGVSGDGFWARDMSFENTAGPDKHQAVAFRSGSDRSVYYRCSFKGYQDTLFVHSLRQFYRDCHIYGTIDFIFGNAAAILQSCDILVRKPMGHQANMITAQGRDDPNQATGISIHVSRVRPTQDLAPVRGSFNTYLGRPWQRYSRTVFLKTDLDGLIHPEGWAKWRGDFALDTLYYGEYMNIGDGAATSRRVNWPGFHVLRDSVEAAPFTVESFIQGRSWIPASGVPFWAGL